MCLLVLNMSCIMVENFFNFGVIFGFICNLFLCREYIIDFVFRVVCYSVVLVIIVLLIYIVLEIGFEVILVFKEFGFGFIIGIIWDVVVN